MNVGLQMTEVRYVCLSLKKPTYLHLKYLKLFVGNKKIMFSLTSFLFVLLLKSGYAPIEFFLEGTRSRTAKTLTPKFGMFI